MIMCFYCEGFPSTTICLLILESIHCIKFLYSDSNIVLVCKLWRFSNNIMRVTEKSEPSDLHEDSKSAPILLADVTVFELWVVLLWEQPCRCIYFGFKIRTMCFLLWSNRSYETDSLLPNEFQGCLLRIKIDEITLLPPQHRPG